jgi:penicillin-binding protein 1A
MTAATMFMDVVTNFAPSGSRAFYPTQADGAERGPVRLRSALQFSLNIPAIKAGIINGIDHTFNKFKDYGLSFPAGTAPVVSQGIGTLDTHPIEMISAYGAIANGGVLMPRHTILKVLDENGNQVWPLNEAKASGKRIASRQAAYIMTDILAGNTVRSINPFWGKWRITDGVTGSRVRPAAYKTGTTSDNRDVHAYGYLAPPSNKDLPALVAGVWMGNSDNSPNDGKLSLDTSAPLWSAILSDVSKGMPIEGFGRTRPKGLETATVDAFTGMKPGPTTRKTVEELFIPGTQPRRSADVSVAVNVDASSGLLWREGCAGPEVTRSFIDFSNVESGYRSWQRADIAWQARAARGPGVSGGPKGTHTAYLYGSGFYPFGASWGGRFAPTKNCKLAPPPEPEPCFSLDPLNPCPSTPPEETPPPEDPGNGGGPNPRP